MTASLAPTRFVNDNGFNAPVPAPAAETVYENKWVMENGEWVQRPFMLTRFKGTLRDAPLPRFGDAK